MKIIGFVSWKGGTGKTLLSFNTIERSTAAGLRTLGCDFDPQRMLIRQDAVRRQRAPEATELDIVEADLTLEGIDALAGLRDDDRYDLVVCDMPGADSFVMDRALDLMDAILIPTNGSPYEIINTSNLIDKTAQAGWPAYLVPNNLPPFRNRKGSAREVMGQMAARTAPTQLVRRLTHWDAAAEGLTATEFAPTSPAATEIREFWAWLQGAIDIRHKEQQEVSRPEVRYA